MYRDFDALVEAVKKTASKRVVAVAAAEDPSIIEAVLYAKRQQIADPILVGDVIQIKKALEEMGLSPSDFDIVAAGKDGPGQTAVDLVRSGDANFLMKGGMETRDMLRPVVSRDNDLGTGRTMSHLAVNKLPEYHKLIANTDGGMCLYPTLEEKKHIIENAAAAFRAMGYENPKIAVLACIETVNPKIIETVEAAKLEEMNKNGEIKGCTVIGPMSYDVAMSAEIAHHKGIDCPYSEDFDVLVAPNINAGNILGKTWTTTVHSKMAGIIVGAKVPIVLNSRGASAEEKYLSIVLAARVASGKGNVL